MRRITDVLINAISVKKLAGPIVMKMAVNRIINSPVLITPVSERAYVKSGA